MRRTVGELAKRLYPPEKRSMGDGPQTSRTVLMVRPAGFGFNAEAARSNVFSHAPADPDFARMALAEFEAFAQRLADAGVQVLILEDSAEPEKPDAVFPNNWFSTHADGSLVTYPMSTAPRRLERRVDDLRSLVEVQGFRVERIVDLSFHERHGHFLEGTGSLVLDRPRRRAFASRSSRTDPAVIADFDDRLDYSTMVFEAHDRSGRSIYHTNVLLSLGSSFAVLCTEAVAADYREILAAEIESGGRTLIEVDHDQMRQFACNLIELSGASGPVIALSAAARRSYRPEQLRVLERFGELVQADIPTIEAVGGGSVRCMIAEVHLPRRA
jgi:hypothetical protein